MALVIRMLLRPAGGLVHFILFLGVVVFAFACAGTCAFSSVDGFHSIAESMETLVYYLGFENERYDYRTLVAVQPTFSRMFVMIYMILIALVLLNVFIAILMDGYNEVVLDPRVAYSLAEEIAEGWARRVDNLLFTCGLASTPVADLDEIVELLETDNEHDKYTYSEFLHLLKKPLRHRTDALVRQLHVCIANFDSSEVWKAQHAILGLDLKQIEKHVREGDRWPPWAE